MLLLPACLPTANNDTIPHLFQIDKEEGEDEEETKKK